ncbi:MAG: hypothetical protein QNI86_03765 [Halieaceae bacterium]|nr:hypothetical protein [Halieaceae bacterium]
MRESFTAPLITRLAVCCLLLALPAAVTASDTLIVEFSDREPGNTRTYASDSALAVGTLQVRNGRTATLSAESGRQYRLEARGWRWGQVQEVPDNVDSVQVTPVVEGDQVSVDVTVFQQRGDRRLKLDSAVSGAVGEWLQVLGPRSPSRSGNRVYGTASSTAGSASPPELYIRVLTGDGR